jgi:hypothetical protein
MGLWLTCTYGKYRLNPVETEPSDVTDLYHGNCINQSASRYTYVYTSDIVTGRRRLKQVLTMENVVDQLLSNSCHGLRTSTFHCTLTPPSPASMTSTVYPFLPSGPTYWAHLTVPALQTSSSSASSCFPLSKTDGKWSKPKQMPFLPTPNEYSMGSKRLERMECS